MIYNFRQITPNVLEEILEDPDVVEAILYYTPDQARKKIEEYSGCQAKAVANVMVKQLGDMLNSIHMHLENYRIANTFKDLDSDGGIDIEESWHGIHFLLTGDPWAGEEPYNLVIMGGTEIGENMGYGPARYLEPDEVEEVAMALEEITEEDMMDLYDEYIEEIRENGLYAITGEDDDYEYEQDYIAKHYGKLRDYYLDAAEKGNAMLIYVN